MSMYGFDASFYDYGFSDPAITSSIYGSPRIEFDDNDDIYYRRRPTIPSVNIRTKTPNSSPPEHRHDGTSPLPLGMDWSLPPRVWEGRNSVWPHDSQKKWSYCVTVPSWTVIPSATGVDTVFYKVQVGIQSPEGITSTQEVLSSQGGIGGLGSNSSQPSQSRRTYVWDWKRRANIPESDLQNLINVLSSFSLSNMQDFWGWDVGARSEFSVKVVRKDIEAALLPNSDISIPWSHWIPLKVNAFAWKAALDRIATKTNLVYRGVDIATGCLGCDSHEESTDHLLVRCQKASEVWNRVLLWCKAPMDLFLSVKEVIKMHEGWRFSKNRLKALHCIFLTSLWCIWKARNLKSFNNRESSLEDILGEIKLWSYTWCKYRGKISNLAWHDWINFDIVL